MTASTLGMKSSHCFQVYSFESTPLYLCWAHSDEACRAEAAMWGTNLRLPMWELPRIGHQLFLPLVWICPDARHLWRGVPCRRAPTQAKAYEKESIGSAGGRDVSVSATSFYF